MASFYKRGDYQCEAKICKAGFPQLAKAFESKSDAVAWAIQSAKAQPGNGHRQGHSQRRQFHAKYMADAYGAVPQL